MCPPLLGSLIIVNSALFDWSWNYMSLQDNGTSNGYDLLSFDEDFTSGLGCTRIRSVDMTVSLLPIVSHGCVSLCFNRPSHYGVMMSCWVPRLQTRAIASSCAETLMPMTKYSPCSG